MKNKIVHKFEPITLVGGGFLGEKDLSMALNHGATIVSADGGARSVLESGHVPAAVIGDFDSLDSATRAQLPVDRLHHIAEQDSTDFDKALRCIEAPLVIGVGFMGARVDHQMAALNVLVRRPWQSIILLSEAEAIFHMPRRLRLDLQAGDTVSLMPLAPVSGHSEGLEWPIDGLDFAPAGQIGTSNRATGPLEIGLGKPGMIGFIPRGRFDLLVTAFLALPETAKWPAPA